MEVAETSRLSLDSIPPSGRREGEEDEEPRLGREVERSLPLWIDWRISSFPAAFVVACWLEEVAVC